MGDNAKAHSHRRGRVSPLVATVLLCALTTATAFDVTFDVQPRVLQVGEAATCLITISGLANPPPPTIPSLDGLQVTGTGQNTQMSLINGNARRIVTFTYRIVPTKTGNLSVGPIQYKAKGKTADLPAIELQVVAPGQGRFSGQGQEQAQLRDMLFARAKTQDDSVYNQEYFDLFLSLYARGIRLGREVDIVNIPEGLSVRQIQNLRGTQELVEGQVFDVHRFRVRLQALTAGTFEIAPIVKVQLVVPRNRSQGRSPSDRFFGDSFFGLFSNEQVQPVDVTAAPISLTVKPLPSQDRPQHFSGAVGQFTFDVQVAPAEVAAGEPVTITSTITGKGNITSVSAPQIVLGETFKIYDAKLSDKRVNDATGEGSKVFEQVVIPNSSQPGELPAAHFSFFDPAKERYITLTRGPFPLTITAAAEGSARLFEGRGQRVPESNRQLGRDIVYLKPAPAHWTRTGETPWYASPLVLGIQVIPPLGLLLVFLLARRRDALASDVAKARRLTALRSARTSIHRAETAIASGDVNKLHEALWSALTTYFGNCLNLPPGEVTKERVFYALGQGGVDDQTAGKLQHLFDACERHRFAGGSVSATDMKDLLNELNTVLKACEKMRLS